VLYLNVVFAGLIVGALIKYTTNASTAVYMDISDGYDVSNGTYSPPSYVRLTVRLHNDSNKSNIVEVEQQQYEYSLMSVIPAEELNSSSQSHNSIELDTTVTTRFCCFVCNILNESLHKSDGI
jgi:hypothetical protein